MNAPRSRRSFACAVALAAALTSIPAFAVGSDPGTATPVQREQAQSRFLRGRELYGQHDYMGALSEFDASHEIVASPNARLYAARCLREMGKLVAAYSEFGRTAVEAKELSREDSRYLRTGESAEEERKAIAPRLGFITVTVDHAKETTVLRVAGEEIRHSGWSEPIPAAPGVSEISLETPARAAIRQTVELAAGQMKTLEFDVDAAPPLETAQATPEPPPTPAAPHDDGEKSRRTMRVTSYVVMGVGALGFATFAIFGALSNTQYSDLKTSCGETPCPPSRQGDIDSGRRDQTIANVGLVVGLVGAAAGVTLFVLSVPKKAQAAHAAPPPRATITMRPGGLALGGVF